MIWAIIQFLQNSAVFRRLALAALAALAAVGLVARERRDAAKDALAKRAAQDAQAHTETVERVLDEKPSDDPADDIRRRLRDRAKRKP